MTILNEKMESKSCLSPSKIRVIDCSVLGVIDDNVHFVQVSSLINALMSAGKPHKLLVSARRVYTLLDFCAAFADFSKRTSWRKKERIGRVSSRLNAQLLRSQS